MKLIYKIARISRILLIPCCLLTSCNYLDIIPPAQADFDDTMKDEASTLGFLYTCYGYVPRVHPFNFQSFEYSADEIASPKMWDDYQQQMAWGILSPSYYNSWGGDDMNIWTPSYNWLGYVHHFLSLIDELHPIGVTDDDKAQYKAECYFLEAYYHFRVLQAFGPCPLITEKVDPNITNDGIPGRSHFDYCVDYIVNKLDDAAHILPAVRTTEDLGRATSTICKCLKARVLLYAASPLWNGSFFDPNWKNVNYETPEYGKELVNTTYKKEKWDRALIACQQALTAADDAGYKLFDIETANKKAERDGVGLPFIPGKEDDTPENKKFKERVRMFQYLVTANEGDNNKEIIWGQRIDADVTNGGEATDSRLPNRVVKKSDGTLVGGWAGLAPTLYAVQHFYTENGELPELDAKFPVKKDWYTRFYEGATSPALATNNLDGEDVKNDIIKLNANREARFYAWIAFDGCEYAKKINDGNPLWINFKNTNTNGWHASDERNVVGTGYLSKKYIDPNIKFSANGSRTHNPSRRPFIRMAELYLNLAECYAALDDAPNAIINLNIVRKRAGIKELKTTDLSTMSITEWVRNERFVELYEEGHRYYDLRRWAIAPQMLKAGLRYGLNGLLKNPSFEEFNQPTLIDQPFKWVDRSYLLPIWSRSDMDELYSNPQMVQAPGY
ncbi:RagB/SusD family nutrient uptake outer membrane protein [Bacteroides finegoldii]|uniref:RagB/SusD family nutrient uptake outer membrane protein n=1 Tax=Bacteroides finegoldii TaxID=338188 RepID=UPI00242FAE73|nr:RagB/SusD family nutrient uptake outer membrane protein [Bacteroides finegoldii]